MERVAAGPVRHAFAFGAGVIVVMLVIGVAVANGSRRPAGLSAPVLGKTIDVIPIRGKVFIRSPRSPRKGHRITAATQIPFGSIIDVRAGAARLIAAYGGGGRTQSSTFHGGELRVTQRRVEHGLLEVQLVDNLKKCGRVHAANHGSTGTTGQTSTLAGYPSSMTVSGRNGFGSNHKRKSKHATDASAGVAVWDTIDTCTGTTIRVRAGQVETSALGAPIQFEVPPHETVGYQCSIRPASTGYCAAILGLTNAVFNGVQVPGPSNQFTFVTRRSDSEYSLVITRRNGTSSSVTYPLGPADARGYHRSDVLCVPDQGAGTYQANWSIAGILLPALRYHVPAASANVGPCSSIPYSRGIPSDLDQQFASAHFVVHYSADPTDPNFVDAQTATNVANAAEQAYTYDTTTLGMPTYADGGGGIVDIYLEASISGSGQTLAAPLAGQNQLPGFGFPSAAYIVLRPGGLNDPHQIPVTVFWVLENAIGRLVPLEHAALSGSMGWWAAANLLQSAPSTPTLNQPLDCDSTCPFGAVNRHWRFYQHLAENYGNGIVPQILSEDAALIQANPTGPQMDTALQTVLASHGSSLANELAAYTLEDVSNSWKAPWVGGGGLSNHSFGSVSLNPAGQNFTQRRPVMINRLASRYLRVAVTNMEPCVQDTLTLTTRLPSGGIVPGAAEQTGNQSTVVPLLPSSTPTQAQMQITFDSCNGVTVLVPFVNGTTGPQPLPFTTSAALVRTTTPAIRH